MADNELKPSQKKKGLSADNKHKAQPKIKTNEKASRTSKQKAKIRKNQQKIANI